MDRTFLLLGFAPLFLALVLWFGREDIFPVTGLTGTRRAVMTVLRAAFLLGLVALGASLIIRATL